MTHCFFVRATEHVIWRPWKDIFTQFYFVIVVCMYVPVAARRDVTQEANQRRLDSLNNIVTVIIFFIFVTNIFITVFGMERTGLFARMHFWFLIYGGGGRDDLCIIFRKYFWEPLLTYWATKNTKQLQAVLDALNCIQYEWMEPKDQLSLLCVCLCLCVCVRVPVCLYVCSSCRADPPALLSAGAKLPEQSDHRHLLPHPGHQRHQSRLRHTAQLLPAVAAAAFHTVRATFAGSLAPCMYTKTGHECMQGCCQKLVHVLCSVLPLDSTKSRIEGHALSCTDALIVPIFYNIKTLFFFLPTCLPIYFFYFLQRWKRTKHVAQCHFKNSKPCLRQIRHF